MFGSGERAALIMPATGVPQTYYYPNARAEIRSVEPRELGVSEVGHFGFFRERFRDSLWRETADWLERQ